MSDMMSTVMPDDAYDVERWEHTRLRRQMMEGSWLDPLRAHMSMYLDPSRQDSWGVPTTSLNLFKSIIKQLAVIYNDDPVVSNDLFTPESESYFKNMNVFSRHQRHSEYVIGLGDSLARIEWNPGNQVSNPGINIRLVPPDYIVAYSMPMTPSIPVCIEEARRRTHPYTGKEAWYWDCWDISDPLSPMFRVYTDAEEEEDVTDLFAPEYVYPYIDPDGRPYLPYVMTHAADTGCLWATNEWSEIVCATLDAALLWSFWIHVVKDSSWSQKYGIDVQVSGLSNKGVGLGQARQYIPTDPNSIILFETKNEKNGSLGSFDLPVSAEDLAKSIQMFMATVSQHLGISASDVERVQSESGVAIQLRRDAVRRIQKRYIAQFRKSDTELLNKVALINNLYSPIKLPVGGYNVEYPAMPLSQEEMVDRLNRDKILIDMGLKSKVDILMEMHPGMSRDDARRLMGEIHLDNKMV
jgi:hypothetical protein